jgi:D-alanine-D-alanine ligase
VGCYPGEVPKLRVGIVFGGRSTEHEVSVRSATAIVNALDRARYEPVLIGLDPQGEWRVCDTAVHENKAMPAAVFEDQDVRRGTLVLRDGVDFVSPRDQRSLLEAPLDVLFPIIHGRGGEDGALQGVFEVSEVPYVGSSVLASAVCMDKPASKALLRAAGLPVLSCVETSRQRALEAPDELIERVEARFEYPVFVKPSKTGSSVGVHKASGRSELSYGIKQAARYDLDVMVEPGVNAREIECAVLGGHDPAASVLGEIVPAGEWYDYAAKYERDDTEYLIPPRIAPEAVAACEDMGLRAYQALGCRGYGRVDVRVDEAGTPHVLEVNTLPGMTSHSLLPKLAAHVGIDYAALCERILWLAHTGP